MPSHVPRAEPTRKQEQLDQKEFELHRLLQLNASPEKIKKAVEKYRAAQLSFFKAVLHMIWEKEVQNKPHHFRQEDIEARIVLLHAKTDADFVQEIKIKYQHE